jgi:hypothetical protein
MAPRSRLLRAPARGVIQKIHIDTDASTSELACDMSCRLSGHTPCEPQPFVMHVSLLLEVVEVKSLEELIDALKY